MKLFKFFITAVAISALSSMTLDAAKNPKRKNSDQEHDFEPSKKTRTGNSLLTQQAWLLTPSSKQKEAFKKRKLSNQTQPVAKSEPIAQSSPNNLSAIASRTDAKVSVDDPTLNLNALPEDEKKVVLAARKDDDKKEDKYERDDKEEKVDIDTALIKKEQKEQRELALPHTLLPYIAISKIDKRILPDDILYTIFEFLNPRDEKEFHQLLARLARSSGKAGFEQLEKIITHGFCLPPSSSIKNITLPAILKNKAPERSIRLLFGHCNSYDERPLTFSVLLDLPRRKDYLIFEELYYLAIEHKNLNPKIVTELKGKFLDALKDKKKAYNPILFGLAFKDIAGKGHLAVMQELIQISSTQALLSAKYVDWALKRAASKGNLPVVQELIQNPSTKDLLSALNVDWALRRAASGGHHAIVQTFIKESALQASFNEETLYNIMKKYAKTDIIYLTIKNILDQRYSNKDFLQRIKYRLGF